MGFDVPERQSNDYSTFWKLTYRLDEAKKFNFTYSRDFSQWDIYPDGVGGEPGNYGWQYKYDAAHRPYTKNTTQTINLGFSHNITKNTLYEISVGNYLTATDILPRGLNPDQFTLRDSVEETRRDLGSNLDANNDGFVDGVVDANRNYQYDGAGEGYDDANQNGQWDRGEDWVDLNGNGVYDAAEPWLDRANSQGINNLGVYDSWDPYVDLNHNGRWDDAEPQLPEQDWNHNGHWDGERFIDANGNGRYDGWGEGYDDKNRNGQMDRLEVVDRTTEDYAPLDPFRRGEAFVDGDYWFDTGEPFHDLPDSNGFYNGVWDNGETFYDLPSSATANPYVRSPVPTTNGVYDGPNGVFDEYEMYTYPAALEFGMTPDYPVLYTWEDVRLGIRQGAQLWPSDIDPVTHLARYYTYDPAHSTWTNTTTYDQSHPVFDVPNGIWDEGKEAYSDNNGNGTQDELPDHFLNPGMWDASSFWQERESREWTGKFDITSQVNKFHELKSGLELKNRDLSMNAISAPDQPYNNTDVPLPAGAPYPDRGGSRDFYHYRPWEGALYMQDKMEFEGMIVRAGIRGDFVIHDNHIVAESQHAVDLNQPGALLAHRGKMVIAPRLGISHPISTKSKMYFNYGHYYQTPSFEYFYRAATQNISPNTEVGNPNLEYEKTVSYEVGVNTEFAEDWVVDVAGYYRDVYNQIGTVEQRIGPITLNRYFNLGYARARGFEFSLKKNFSRMWALTMNYDFSYAYGKESSAAEGLQQRLNNRPENRDEYPLVWDETHKVSAFFTMMVDQKEKWRPFGVWTPSDWLGTLEFSYGSGLPYTPSTFTTGTPSNLILPNSARYPHTMTVDFKFDKYWELTKGLKFATGVEIYNLLNRRNIRELYADTGNAFDSSHEGDSSKREDFNMGTDYDHNPRNFYPLRQILLHFKLQF
jgi:outer membrane receptor protein involved in Fe transport